MNIYDLPDEEVLNDQWWKPYKDSTLKSMKKDTLIDIIRCLEHNWAGEIKANKVLSYRLKCFLDILEKHGHPEKFTQICALPGEYGYSQESIEPNLNLFWEGKEDYWYHSYLKLVKELKVYKKAIEDIKSYNPCYYELDYDWDEEPIDNYESLDVDYIVDNIRETMKIDEREDIEKKLRLSDLDMIKYFTEEDQLAEEKIIKSMGVDLEDNFYNYYKEENNE